MRNDGEGVVRVISLLTVRPPKQPKYRVRKGLAISLVTATGHPVIDLRLPRVLAAFLMLLGLLVLGMAGLAIYRMVDPPDSSPRSGDRLAFITSSQTREQELQRLIDRDNLRVRDLQKENQERETEVAKLEVRLMDLGNSISGLKTTVAQIPVVKPPTTVAAGGGAVRVTPGAAITTAIAAANSNSVVSNYYAELQKLESQLNGINQAVAEKKASLDSLQQSFNDYNAELVRLTGKEPPLPGPITNLNDARALNPPDILPGDGLLTSPFGWRDSPFHQGLRGWHDGVDIACNVGQPVRATKAGIVTFATMDRNGYGLRVDIGHDSGWLTFYGHNSQILVRVGQYVNKGDTISLCGNTGASTGPHIHYGLHFHGAMTDPLRYITTPVKWQ